MFFQYPGESGCGFVGFNESVSSGRGPWGPPGPPWGPWGPKIQVFWIFGVCVCVCVCVPRFGPKKHSFLRVLVLLGVAGGGGRGVPYF